MAPGLASWFAYLSVRKRKVNPSPPADLRSCHPAASRTFSFEKLTAATSNFNDDCRIGGWQGLYRGYLKSINQVVAIRLQPVIHRDASADQENREFPCPKDQRAAPPKPPEFGRLLCGRRS